MLKKIIMKNLNLLNKYLPLYYIYLKKIDLLIKCNKNITI